MLERGPSNPWLVGAILTPMQIQQINLTLIMVNDDYFYTYVAALFKLYEFYFIVNTHDNITNFIQIMKHSKFLNNFCVF